MLINKISQPRAQPSRPLREPQSYSDPLEVIYLEGHWRLNTVSPLNDFHYDEVKLKQYAAKVREAIVSSVTASSSIKYTVKFQEEEGLKYSEDDASGVQICVYTVQEAMDKYKSVYTAILLSWGESYKLTGAVHLPFMIEKGEQKYATVVRNTMQTLFDCNIRQISLTQNQLLQLGLRCLDLDSSLDQSQSQFVMNYITPHSDVKDKLTITFTMRDIKLIWNVVKEEANESELVGYAYKMLQNQIYNIANLDISYLELCEVLLPRVELRSSGMVKMKTAEIVNCVFTLLNKVCEDSVGRSTTSLGSISS